MDGHIFNGNLQLMIFHRPQQGSVLFELICEQYL